MCTVGLAVERHPATVHTWVEFPDHAQFSMGLRLSNKPAIKQLLCDTCLAKESLWQWHSESK